MMDLDTVLSGIHAYLGHHGYTRVDSVRHVWRPAEQARYLWPRDGELVLVVTGTGLDDDPRRVEDDGCSVALLALRPLPSGRYAWDLVARPPIPPGGLEGVAWTAALWAVHHGLPLSLSICDLWEIAEEVYRSGSSEGGHHG